MPEPEMSQWGQRLRERTQPLQPDDEQYGWTHAILCEALAQPYLQIAELIDPPEPYPPWGPLFDINVCPAWALPWLAQAVGIRLPTGIPEDAARAIIKDAAGHNVGKVSAIKAVLARTLVSSNPPNPPTVWFRERDGSAYRLEIVTLEHETPDPAATYAALAVSIPGGLVWDYRHIDSWDYQAMTDEGGTYAEQSAAYATYADLREHKQGGAIPPPVTGQLDVVTPAVWEYGLAFDPTLDGDFPFPAGDEALYYAYAGGMYSAAPVTIVSSTQVTAHFDPNFSQIPGGSTIEIRNQTTGESFTNTLPINLTA
jgi:hypothetical protein